MKSKDKNILVKTRNVAHILIATTIAFSGCRQEYIDEYFDTYDESHPVSFTTHTDILTRGTPVNSVNEMTSMGVFSSATGEAQWNEATSAPGKMFNTRLDQKDGKWNYANGEIYWGAEDITHNYTFFAYAPFGDQHNGITIKSSLSTPGIPVLTYTVPKNVTQQPDLMVSVPRYNMHPVSNVPLQMKHALTSIGFQIKGYKPEYDEKITGISISGVSVSGDLSLDGKNIVWKNLGAPTKTDFSASINNDAGKNYYSVTGSMSENLIAADGYLMMIPQALGKDAKVTITFSDKSTKEISLDEQKWEAGKRISYNITMVDSGIILLTPEYTVLSPAIHPPENPLPGQTGQTLTVISQDAYGNPDKKPWTLSSNSGWLMLSLDKTKQVPTLSGEGTQTVYLYATANNHQNSAVREAIVTLNYNGKNVAESYIKQNKENPKPEPVHHRASIAGAFWKHNQTGERIVQVNVGNNTGMWTAMVTFYDNHWEPTNGDGVLLATSGSLDETIGTDSPENAEKHQMTGYNYSSTVSGTAGQGEAITFRIGLEKQFAKFKTNPDLYPARYAVIELLYNNHTKTQNIYLRQGEGDDYLMRKSDLGPENITRSSAARFSPYNLTAETLNAQINSSNPAIFTEFPSQVGAFFQHASSKYKNYAWDPHSSSLSVDWSYQATTYDHTHEVGPANYRRPKDENILTSELRQSLWKNYTTAGTFASNDNFVFGYYADGFYDRRISEESDHKTNGVVAAGHRTVAYGGGLFFNSATNASLFFPIGGYRYNTTGILIWDGFKGYYLTSEGASGSKMLTLQYENFAAVENYTSPAALNIRSVRN